LNTPDSQDTQLNRREFVRLNAAAGAGLLLASDAAADNFPLELDPPELVNGLKRKRGKTPLENATWYEANETGEGLLYTFPKGLLARAAYLTADFLVDGEHLAVFSLAFREGEEGPVFTLRYKGLNQCSARIRFPLAAVDLNRWRLPREGAWLKPICGGDRVDLNEVDRMTITILRKSHRPVRWCQTSITLTKDEPPRLQNPVLPKGPLLDELGQSTIHEWPTKSPNVYRVRERMYGQLAIADQWKWPEDFSHWGGWREKRVEGTGFYKTHHDGSRWWLVDPEGYLFWSTGLDCVGPHISAYCEGIESALTWKPDTGREGYADYLHANLVRAFGDEKWYENWSKITLSFLREVGINTVGNWSDWSMAQQAGFPYVRPLSMRLERTPTIYRDFPDVYHPNFEDDAARCGEQLRGTLDDPALIGYFLMNEPTWAFSTELPAEGMLFNTETCETRKELSRFLRKRYERDAALSTAWGIDTSFSQIATGRWRTRLTKKAKEDLLDFSSIMVERLFGTLSGACKAVDPHHLNLGIRYQGVPPEWTVKGMRSFDVFSANYYRDRVPEDVCEKISTMLNMPVMIGEFHFGALDAGLPAPGLVHVPTQEDRGRAYRVYVEQAAAIPSCVGVHYFTLYDQSAMGRFDGENYNIGFLDVCNRPYQPLGQAARLTHEVLYRVATGEIEPYNNPPEYLPRLF